MKESFDKKTEKRNFKVGDKVLVLLPIPGNPLKASFSGPWEIIKKISEINYLVETPNRRKKHQLCHINMLKPYLERKSKVIPEMVVKEICKDEVPDVYSEWPDSNFTILGNLSKSLEHLDVEKRNSLVK